MCGILLSHYGESCPLEDSFHEFGEEELARGDLLPHTRQLGFLQTLIPHIVDRGPNYASLKSSATDAAVWFTSILSLREPLTKQCIDINDRFVLQYNGEIYNSSIAHNDTQYIATELSIVQNVPTVIRKLSGEFAYTVYDRATGEIFFGRDGVGKRSLAFRTCAEQRNLCVTSVSGKVDGFQNCEAGVIYIYQSKSGHLSTDVRINEIPLSISNVIDDGFTLLDENIEKLYQHLSVAVRDRVDTIHPLKKGNDPVSVLFSGGLDCSVIAALICHHILESESKTVVELLNVGFENPRTGLLPAQVPDRALGRKSANALKALFPQIDIKFVEVDVAYQEYLEKRDHILELIYPKQTEMDLSIAAAFYFASRGEGFIEQGTLKRASYKRRGIVLFSGLGADELYGGYHKFSNKTPEELVGELETQINNIHDRNLNRDDKVIASNGVEVRYPFLDDRVIEFSTQLPINYKVNKMILRMVAEKKLAFSGKHF